MFWAPPKLWPNNRPKEQRRGLLQRWNPLRLLLMDRPRQPLRQAAKRKASQERKARLKVERNRERADMQKAYQKAYDPKYAELRKKYCGEARADTVSK